MKCSTESATQILLLSERERLRTRLGFSKNRLVWLVGWCRPTCRYSENRSSDNRYSDNWYIPQHLRILLLELCPKLWSFLLTCCYPRSTKVDARYESAARNELFNTVTLVIIDLTVAYRTDPNKFHTVGAYILSVIFMDFSPRSFPVDITDSLSVMSTGKLRGEKIHENRTDVGM